MSSTFLAHFGALVPLALALGLDLFLGDPPNRWHPVAWMGRFIGWAKQQAPAGSPLLRFLYGAALVLLGLVLCTLPAVLLLAGAKQLGVSLHLLLAGLLLKCSFAGRGLFQAAASIRKVLLEGDLPAARRLLAWHLVSRDTSELDEGQVAAAVVESVAENITDGLAAPIFFYLLFGVPGAWAYRFVNTCDSMLGYRDPEHEYLGKFAARLDDLLNWLPSRLTAGLIVLAAWLGKRDAAGAWRTMWAQHGRTASPNAGWTMSAMAGALNVTLAKVDHYRLEGGGGQLTADTIRDTNRLAGLTMVLFVLLVSVLILLGVSDAV